MEMSDRVRRGWFLLPDERLSSEMHTVIYKSLSYPGFVASRRWSRPHYPGFKDSAHMATSAPDTPRALTPMATAIRLDTESCSSAHMMVIGLQLIRFNSRQVQSLDKDEIKIVANEALRMARMV